jgi:hypothetical protein
LTVKFNSPSQSFFDCKITIFSTFYSFEKEIKVNVGEYELIFQINLSSIVEISEENELFIYLKTLIQTEDYIEVDI